MQKRKRIGCWLSKNNSTNLREIKYETLVPPRQDHSIIGTKFIFKNKLNDNGDIIKNKAKMVAQGYSQEEGINYE